MGQGVGNFSEAENCVLPPACVLAGPRTCWCFTLLEVMCICGHAEDLIAAVQDKAGCTVLAAACLLSNSRALAPLCHSTGCSHAAQCMLCSPHFAVPNNSCALDQHIATPH